MKKLDIKVLRNLKEHKAQYIAITLLVAMGITIFLAFDMAVYNLKDTVDTYYEDYALADVYLYGSEIVNTKEKVSNIDGVDVIDTRGVYEGKIVFSEDTAKLKILNATNNVNKVYVDEGDTNIENNEILIFNSFAEARDIKVGDSLLLRLEGNEYSVVVKGLAYSPEFLYLTESEKDMIPRPDEYGVAYISDELMEEVYGIGFENELVLTVEDESDISTVKDKLKEIVSNQGITPGIVLTKNEQFSYAAAEEEINGEIALSQSMPILFLLIAAIVMAVLVARMVENDRTEIGILKALGYTTKKILLSYIKITLLIGIIGAILGMVIGGLISYQFTKVYTAFFEIPILVYNFDAKYLVIAFIIAIVLSSLAGIWGGRKVLKLMPQESMRPKSPAKGKKMFVEKFRFYNKLKFTNKLVLRNIFRNKKRVLLIILGVAISFAMLLLPFSFYDLMDRMFIDQYTEVQVIDYDISFDNFVIEKDLEQIKTSVDGNLEGYLEIPVDITSSDEKTTINVLGIDKDTEVFHLINSKGENISVNDGEFYISEGFANANQIEKGDTVGINVVYDDKLSTSVKVTDIVDQKLGSNAYMTNISLTEVFYYDEITNGAEIYTGVYVQGEIDEEAIEQISFTNSILSVNKLIETYEDFMGLIYFMLGMLVLFGGIIAFVIIFVISIMNINERKPEFSSLRVLGLRNNEIYKIISRENIIATIIGIIIGIPLGVGMIEYISGYYSNELYSFSMSYTPMMFVYATLFTILFVYFAQRITKKKIKNLDFIEALKNRIS